jgi:hypothetical protein
MAMQGKCSLRYSEALRLAYGAAPPAYSLIAAEELLLGRGNML